MDRKISILRTKKPCPICKKQSQQKYHPFCSKRCANIDLNRWLSGAYIIRAPENEEEKEGKIKI